MNPVFTLPPIGLLAEYFWAMDRDDDGRITDSDIFGFLTSCFPDDPFSVALLWSKARSYSSDKDGKLLITSDDSETLIRFLADFSALQNHVPKNHSTPLPLPRVSAVPLPSTEVLFECPIFTRKSFEKLFTQRCSADVMSWEMFTEIIGGIAEQCEAEEFCSNVYSAYDGLKDINKNVFITLLHIFYLSKYISTNEHKLFEKELFGLTKAKTRKRLPKTYRFTESRKTSYLKYYIYEIDKKRTDQNAVEKIDFINQIINKTASLHRKSDTYHSTLVELQRHLSVENVTFANGVRLLDESLNYTRRGNAALRTHAAWTPRGKEYDPKEFPLENKIRLALKMRNKKEIYECVLAADYSKKLYGDINTDFFHSTLMEIEKNVHTSEPAPESVETTAKDFDGIFEQQSDFFSKENVIDFTKDDSFFKARTHEKEEEDFFSTQSPLESQPVLDQSYNQNDGTGEPL